MVIAGRAIGTPQIVTQIGWCDCDGEWIGLLYYLVGHALQDLLDALLKQTHSWLSA